MIARNASRAAAALQVLYKDPHPKLRAELPKRLAQLHALAQQSDLTKDAELLYRERAFIDALDSLARFPGLGAQLAVNEYIAASRKAPRAGEDMRPLLVQALFLLDLGRRQDAAALGTKAKGRVLRREHRRLIGDMLDRLMVLDPWRQLLWEPDEPATKR